MQITDLKVRKVFDSRGEATIQIELQSHKSNVHFFACVPAGKSTGEREVKTANFDAALKSSKAIRSKVLGRNFDSVRELDELVAVLDGTPDRSKLGGNVSLGISIATLRAFAHESGVEIWEELRRQFFREVKGRKLPLLFSNLINGGAHAQNGLDIQEYMAVAAPQKSVSVSVAELIATYKKLGQVLRNKKKDGVLPIGDEGGYAVKFKNNMEPLTILSKVISDTPATKFNLALDVAASNFFKKGKYNFDNRALTSDQLLKKYLALAEKTPKLISIEDPFAENDFATFGKLLPSLTGRWVVGDDLTTTNPESITFAADNRMISGVIVKPNQIGSVSAACDAITTAHSHKVRTIVSHRSGEVDDNFIIHLARAANADALKIGAPIHERIYKFDEAVRIYE